MSLELLPNEILLEIFNFFNGIDLLRMFYGLNYRLNLLLHEQFQDCSFNFQSISKRDFDIICQRHLPSMADYIINLHLSDDEETPAQIKLFHLYNPSLDQLQSLSLSNLRSYETLMQIIEECQYISNLTHLNFINCYFQDNQANFQLIINHIWNLPKLIHCTIGIGIKGQCLFPIPKYLSSSLEYLSIEKIQVKLSHINRLFEYTPALKYLSISVSSFIDNDYIPIPLPTLIDLSLTSFFTCNASNMNVFLQNLSNLRRLNIDLSSELVDGNQWEEIISNSLPNLEIFQLKMKTTLPVTRNIQGRVAVLINSFKTPFWIDDRQWFIRCLTWERTIYLYTLSNHYEENLPVAYQSTCPFDDQQDFYESITKITSPTFFHQPASSPHIHLPNINTLSINLPICDQFWFIVPNLDHLKTLKIFLHTNTFQSQVQALLNRAPHLNRFSINQYESTPLQTSLFKYTNSSVHELDLRNVNHYFNEDECITLSHSPLGIQCEVLFMLVQNCECIISLVENMLKLRVLNVRCKHEKYIELSPSIDGNDEEDKNDCLQWLENHLPPACVVIKDPKLTCNILIWI